MGEGKRREAEKVVFNNFARNSKIDFFILSQRKRKFRILFFFKNQSFVTRQIQSMKIQ